MPLASPIRSRLARFDSNLPTSWRTTCSATSTQFRIFRPASRRLGGWRSAARRRITVLTVHASVVALSANKQWSKRARIVLRHLLDTLRALYRCGQASTLMARPGRPRLCSDGLLRRILAMRNEGMSYQTICDTLNAEGVPTPTRRPRWCRSHVSRLVYTREPSHGKDNPTLLCPGNGAGESERRGLHLPASQPLPGTRIRRGRICGFTGNARIPV
jgi:Recombinase